MMPWIRYATLGLCLIATVACDGKFSNDGGGSPTAPTTSFNLAGLWTGTVGEEGESDPAQVTWTASHNGNSATGPLTITFTDTDNGIPYTFRGMLAGTISGSQLALTVSLPAGTFPEVPGCSMAGSGTTTASNTTISADITVTFSPACLGTIADSPTDTDRLRLRKQ